MKRDLATHMVYQIWIHVIWSQYTNYTLSWTCWFWSIVCDITGWPQRTILCLSGHWHHARSSCATVWPVSAWLTSAGRTDLRNAYWFLPPGGIKSRRTADVVFVILLYSGWYGGYLLDCCCCWWHVELLTYTMADDRQLYRSVSIALIVHLLYWLVVYII